MPEGSLVLIPRGNRHMLRGNPGDKTTLLEDIPVERIIQRVLGRNSQRHKKCGDNQPAQPAQASPQSSRPANFISCSETLESPFTSINGAMQ